MKHLMMLAMATVIGTGTAYAQDMTVVHPGLTDRWTFDAAVMQQRVSAEVRSTRIGDTETKIDLDDLGVDDSEVTGQFSLSGRFADRWRANFAYTNLAVSGDTLNERDFNFGGIEFPIATRTESDLEIDTFIVSLDYAIRQKENLEWGVGAGLHAIDLSISFEAAVNNVSARGSDEDFLAPLPNLRWYMKYAISDKWLLSATAGWLGAKVDDYDGQLLVAGVKAEYRFNDNWSLGVGAQLIDIDLEVDDGDSRQDYDIQLPGAGVTLTYSIPR